jgi:acyl-CoA thioesterase YciA
MTESKSTGKRHAAVRTLAMPADTNSAGDIFGGWLMSQMDIAGEITARQRARTRVVTVAIDGMEFHQPVYVGDVLSCYTTITRVGKSSITIHIEAVAMRGTSGESVMVTEGTFVYVALDKNGHPCPVQAAG